QTEAVVYVYQRSTLLACFFSLLGLIALAGQRHARAALMFFLAFESKESALAVPLAVACVSGFRAFGHSIALKPATTRLRVAAIVSVAVLSAAVIALLAYQNEKTVGIGAAEIISPFRYLLIETRVIFTYIRLLFFPYPQSLEYEFQHAG